MKLVVNERFLCYRVKLGEHENLEEIAPMSAQEKVAGKGDLLLSAILRSSQGQNLPSFKHKLETQPEAMSVPTFHLSNLSIQPPTSHPKKIPPSLQILPPDKFKEKFFPGLLLNTCQFSKRSAEHLEMKEHFCGKESATVTSANRFYDDKNSKTVTLFYNFLDRFRTKQCTKKDDDVKCQDELETCVEELNTLDLNKRAEVRYLKCFLKCGCYRVATDWKFRENQELCRNYKHSEKNGKYA